MLWDFTRSKWTISERYLANGKPGMKKKEKEKSVEEMSKMKDNTRKSSFVKFGNLTEKLTYKEWMVFYKTETKNTIGKPSIEYTRVVNVTSLLSLWCSFWILVHGIYCCMNAKPGLYHGRGKETVDLLIKVLLENGNTKKEI